MVTVWLIKGRKEGRLTGLVTSCARNCLLKHVIERDRKGRIEVTRGGGRRRKQLLGDCKENWELKEEALNGTLGENWLWNWLWTCRKTDPGMSE
jgi:hypothetical protein